VTVRTWPRRVAPPGKRAGEAVPRKWIRRLVQRGGREAQKLLPAWLFFYLSFSLLRLTQTAVLQEFGVSSLPPSRVLAGSLIVAKALLTVDSFRVFAPLEQRPVLVTAFCMTFVYALLVFFFQYAEALFELRALGLTEASLEFGRRLASLRFWVIQVWLLILIFAFSATRAFARRLGRHRFRHYFLGR